MCLFSLLFFQVSTLKKKLMKRNCVEQQADGARSALVDPLDNFAIPHAPPTGREKNTIKNKTEHPRKIPNRRFHYDDPECYTLSHPGSLPSYVRLKGKRPFPAPADDGDDRSGRGFLSKSKRAFSICGDLFRPLP